MRQKHRQVPGIRMKAITTHDSPHSASTLFPVFALPVTLSYLMPWSPITWQWSWEDHLAEAFCFDWNEFVKVEPMDTMDRTGS